MTGTSFGRRPLVTAALALLVGLGMVAPVEAAMRVPANGDSHQRACRALQDKGNALIAEYKDASNERRGEILNELQNNGKTWVDIGCKARYGSISLEELPGSGSPHINPGGGIIDDGGGPETPVVTQPVLTQPDGDQEQDTTTSKGKKGKKSKKGGKGRRR